MSSPSLPTLSSLRAFEAVARHASFKAAAAKLLVTPSAVSHQIRQLEAHLEMRPLLRTPRTVTLTEQGRVLYTATAEGFGEIKRAIARLREDACAAPLTLSAIAAFLNLWLVPRLGLLQTALPNIDVRLHASDMPEELRRGAIDVAIRYGSGPFPGTASTPLCADRFTPACSPSLGLIRQDDLHRIALIHIDGRRRPAPAPDGRAGADRREYPGLIPMRVSISPTACWRYRLPSPDRVWCWSVACSLRACSRRNCSQRR